jgi:hypothetical protein
VCVAARAQLNALGVPPPRGHTRWSAVALVHYYCDVVLPPLDEDVRTEYLSRYRRRRRVSSPAPEAAMYEFGPHLSIEEYRRGALSADGRFDAGADEVPFLDAHFNLLTTFYYSAGNVRAARVKTSPAARGLLDSAHQKYPTPLTPAEGPVLEVRLLRREERPRASNQLLVPALDEFPYALSVALNEQGMRSSDEAPHVGNKPAFARTHSRRR